MRFFLRGFLVTLACSRIVLAGPVNLPPVNLGDTSFNDGIANPGWLLEETFDFYQANHFNGPDGGRVPGQNKLTTASAVTHLAYISKYQWLGAYLGAEILVPLADINLDTSLTASSRVSGIGDLTISPLIMQWNNLTLFGQPFFQRIALPVDFPTGQYDASRPANPGNNIYSINPYYAFTVFPISKLDFSARLNYLWNSENDNPYQGIHASNTQPGQAFHANFAASYEVLKGLRMGINGYALQQLTDDKINGGNLANSKERVFGIGPGLVYQQGTFWIYLNSYFETGAENRPEGAKIIFRISKVF